MFRPALAVTMSASLAAFSLFLLPRGNAQQPIRVSVNEVIVPVTVTDDKGRFVPKEIPGTEKTVPCQLVLLAMGFVHPVAPVLAAFGVERDARGNAKAHTDEGHAQGSAAAYATNVPKVFAAGDMRRGQSLVVWAIREGRQCARSVDAFLMGSSTLPR